MIPDVDVDALHFAAREVRLSFFDLFRSELASLVAFSSSDAETK